jgi:hypothetical protein
VTGHVFVVPGSLDALDCDDVVVPTDALVRVRRIWDRVLGWSDDDARQRELDGLRLSDERRCVQLPEVPGGRRRWLLSVARGDADVRWLVAGLEQCLTEIAGRSVGRRRGRQRIALPTLGVAAGGYGHKRGEVIAELLRTAGQVASSHDVDIVFVAFDPSDHSAYQTIRAAQGGQLPRPESEAAASRLAGLVQRGQLALFLGAGTGVSAGLPSWNQLLRAVASDVGLDFDAEQWRDLGPLDAAELLRRAAAERHPGERHALGRLVAAHVTGVSHYSLMHVQLASLGCEQVVTTNFDRLYETAVQAVGRHRPMVVLPSTSGRELATADEGGWLLKLHGDVATPQSIVLDRRSFVTYDAQRRPLGGVLQSTLLTKHLLVVGASMTDDNVIRLVHEVAELGELSGETPTLGTVLTLARDPLRERLWRPEFEYVAFGAEVDGDGAAARELEIFLDRVALLANRANAHLLSASYGALLDDLDQQRLAADARALYERAVRVGVPAWQDVANALAAFGAGPRRVT